MKRDAIRAEVNDTLKLLGVRAKQYRWDRAELIVIVDGEFVSFRFPAGMTRREVARQLGRLEGMLEILARLGYGDREPPSSEVNASARAHMASRSNGRGAHP